MSVLAIARDHSCLVATPPADSAGVADMLVALGETRIGVTHVEAIPDSCGSFLLALADDETTTMLDAVEVLTGIGCHCARVPSTAGVSSWVSQVA